MNLKIAAVFCLMLAIIAAWQWNTDHPGQTKQGMRLEHSIVSREAAYSRSEQNSASPPRVRSHQIDSLLNPQDPPSSSLPSNRQSAAQGERAIHPFETRIEQKPAKKLSGQEQIGQPLPAIQLTDTVRLPAAIMATASDKEFIPYSSPTPVEQAKDEIGTNYYRDLAAQVAAGTAPSLNKTSTGEETSLIETSPESEEIRKGADELFRALFGDAAYNRQTMNSLIESRLPAIAE